VDVIVTVGPACWSEEVLDALLREGVRDFRFPFSKEDPQTHLRHADRVRGRAKAAGVEVRLLADLPGSKPRLSNREPMRVEEGRAVTIAVVSGIDGCDLHLDPPFSGMPDVEGGHEALLGDGDAVFHVDSAVDGVLTGRFGFTGELERRLGFAIPGVDCRVECFTEDDRNYCRAVAASSVFDTVALSFVRDEADVELSRAWLADELGWRPSIIAKIESPQGVVHAEAIARAADQVMIARGDLALWMGVEGLWGAQRAITAAGRKAATPVIGATSFLQSMVTGRRPTRSEAVDVAAAVELGMKALMLSAETTIGIDPASAVRTLGRLAEAAARAGRI